MQKQKHQSNYGGKLQGSEEYRAEKLVALSNQKSPDLSDCCRAAGVQVTDRQRRKFNAHRGAAWEAWERSQHIGS